MNQLNLDELYDFDRDLFYDASPFPFYTFDGLLKQEFFDDLHRNWPDIKLFGEEKGVSRKVKGQRPHDRHLMSYSTQVKVGKNLYPVNIDALPDVWQEFVSLHGCLAYIEFLSDLFQTSSFDIRYDWHMASTGNDVSPHIDSKGKVGSHLFYMLDESDWNDDWGGHTVALSNCKVSKPNPEVSDFAFAHYSQIINNKSFLFKNTDQAWHAVDRIECPIGRYRKLVNVVCLKK